MPASALILNVNDDPSGRYAVSRILKQAGHRILEAETGQQALALLSENPELVILDINLPDVSGLEVCRQIRERTQEWLPVLHLTATYAGPEHLVAGLESGADGYLAQPVAPAVLLATAHSLLRIRRERPLRESQQTLQQARAELECRVAVRTAELERANAELQDFATIASHDLQEPLRKVRSFGELLERELGDDLGEDAALYLREMLRSTERMQSLVHDLLALARVTTRPQDFVPVDLADVLDDVLDDLALRLHATNAQVRLRALPVIDGDPTQMRQLFLNLIGNALKFHRTGIAPVITVEGHSLAGGVLHDQAVGEVNRCRITVSDNGIGFDEKYLDRIFAPCQRLHGRNEYEGTGMGLAICRRIVERHGGRISARSRPGEGSTFSITLPLRHLSESA